jgi:acyl transferase domain-containing protein
MSDETKERLKQAVTALRDMREALEAERRDKRAPIAIIGMACRFPGGASGVDAYWRNLTTGKDAIAEIPRDRFDLDAYYDPDPDAPGKMYTRYGGFLREVAAFDAPFFGISAREAAMMDPQQRHALEVAWEALEHAGQVPAELAKAPAGVFLGICNNDYAKLRSESQDYEGFDIYSYPGNALSIASGRISYALGLEGPSLSIDTACSSSLVAVHSALSSLRRRECDLAIAGGVNLLLSPETFVQLSRLKALSKDGRCRTFDAAANGYVRGEGCGMVVLKRAADAVRDRDRIWALIRGSAVNNDGKTAGITAPNVSSQIAVLRRALEDAAASPSDLGFVETHGTGTPLGDPIEAEALKEVLGVSGERCWLGAVKSNIGHLEAAAGVAGLIKAVLCLSEEKIPQNLHFSRLNPRISFDGSELEVPTKLEPWPRTDRVRLAGVSSFGMSGTNAHLILEEAPRRQGPT